jgi:hypothetical protein
VASKTIRLLRETDQTVVGVEILYEVPVPGRRTSRLIFLSAKLLEAHIARLEGLGENTSEKEEALAVMRGSSAGE